MVILGRDIKPLVPGDPVYVGSAFSRPSLATKPLRGNKMKVSPLWDPFKVYILTLQGSFGTLVTFLTDFFMCGHFDVAVQLD